MEAVAVAVITEDNGTMAKSTQKLDSTKKERTKPIDKPKDRMKTQRLFDEALIALRHGVLPRSMRGER